MPSRKPLIGVPGLTTWVNVHGALRRQVTILTTAMLEPIAAAGGNPVLLTDVSPIEHVPDLVAALDGVLFPGGQDVDPSNYGQEQKVNYSGEAIVFGKPYLRPPMMGPNKVRDHFELAIFREAKSRGLPIMGLCRGMQLLNVAHGGTLHQEVSDVATLMHELDNNGYIHHHPFEIVEGTRVHAAFQSKSGIMPSMHHQAVDTIGEGLIVSGRSPDGVVECIESADPDHFIVGIQGDIERSGRNHVGFTRVYEAFVSACAAKRD
ncbi:MAG: gamma-glutamyl-gamma-aminobutyrate hydrolase family protein [Myxococcota bacterium]